MQNSNIISTDNLREDFTLKITPIIKNEKLKYSCILVLTDGYFNSPKTYLRNIIWCLTEDGTDESIKDYKGSTIIRI